MWGDLQTRRDQIEDTEDIEDMEDTEETYIFILASTSTAKSVEKHFNLY